jgi:hypothetical protein
MFKLVSLKRKSDCHFAVVCPDGTIVYIGMPLEPIVTADPWTSGATSGSGPTITVGPG